MPDSNAVTVEVESSMKADRGLVRFHDISELANDHALASGSLSRPAYHYRLLV